MDSYPIIEMAALDRVVALLKPRKTRELLEILEAHVVEFSQMDHGDIVGPRGVAHAHRLTSEAGLLGFKRLSAACAILCDNSGQRVAEQVEEARSSLGDVLEQTHREIKRSLGRSLMGGDHGVAK